MNRKHPEIQYNHTVFQKVRIEKSIYSRVGKRHWVDAFNVNALDGSCFRLNCQYCDFITTDKESLKQHVNNQHCDICNYENAQIGNIKKRIQTKHQNIPIVFQSAASPATQFKEKICIYNEIYLLSKIERIAKTTNYKTDSQNKRFYESHVTGADTGENNLNASIRNRTKHNHRNLNVVKNLALSRPYKFCFLSDKQLDECDFIKEEIRNVDVMDESFKADTEAPKEEIESVDVGVKLEDGDMKAGEEKLKKEKQRKRQLGKEKTKNIVCYRCGKAFVRDHNRHGVVHAGGRPYPYSHCVKSFTATSSLETHIRSIHERSQLFANPECDKLFNQKTNMDGHCQAIHMESDLIMCQECGRNFNYTSTLRRHVQTVHERQLSHACGQCERKFSCQRNLKKHIETIHLKTRSLTTQILGVAEHIGGTKDKTDEGLRGVKDSDGKRGSAGDIFENKSGHEKPDIDANMNLVSLAKEAVIREPLVALGQEKVTTGEPEDKNSFNIPPIKVEHCKDAQPNVQSMSNHMSYEVSNQTSNQKKSIQEPKMINCSKSKIKIQANHPIIQLSKNLFSDTQTQTFPRENWDPGPTLKY